MSVSQKIFNLDNKTNNKHKVAHSGTQEEKQKNEITNMGGPGVSLYFEV
jgi:hypothetical protein